MNPSAPNPENPKLDQIRLLNDRLRRTRTGGRIVATRGVHALFGSDLGDLLRTIADFDDFGPNNDPYGEHDFGSLQFRGHRVFWKIDYYDHSLQSRSINPASPAVTCRVMTIMLAEEY
ncbi:DUF3768 domain-containing protein [Rhodospira trueperi]|uniref:DUF3768 domain-containing protein n=1 Tax=Rhodospira trueperi TaxID=69960 RepID=A0A1G7EL61_9PROT|nr:DUF3768 domain-containing protein [Rhodospira trueperi]SDE64372.1 Protein of unknown function [Rhodospira trueperi]